MASPTKKTKRTRSKLGRGLSALVEQSISPPVEVMRELSPAQKANIIQSVAQSSPVDEDSSRRIAEIDVTLVVPNPHQPRRVFDEESLEELASSIAEHGLLQPIVVREGSGEHAGRYELIAGERRWRATCRTGQLMIRAIVVQVDDIQSAQLALIENIQREDLNAIERAQGFSVLTTRFSMTQDQVAAKVGINRSSVANLLRLLELDDEIQSMIASGTLGAGHGKALLSCNDADQRLEFAQQAIEEGWSVRVLERATAGRPTQQAPQQVGDGDTQPPKSGGGRVSRIESVLMDLEKQLGEQLGTNVKLRTDQSGKRGSITIEFYDLDHFDGLMHRLGLQGDGGLSGV